MKEPTFEETMRAAGKETAKKLEPIMKSFIELAKEKKMKENGRLKPAENAEHSHLKYKTFKCTKCGHETPIKNPEFGEMKVCPYCDMGILEEVTEINR